MTTESLPLVSIIVLNHNQTETTSGLLKSCQRLRYRNLELIVVDNASEQAAADSIASQFPKVRIIRNRENRSIGAGFNVGMEHAYGDYFLLMHNDTEVTDDLIELMLEPFEQDPTIGIVSPKIKYLPQMHIIQFSGFTPVNLFTGNNRSIGDGENDRHQHDNEGDNPYANGVAMMVRREVYGKVGPMSEDYTLYYGDFDWSMQIQQAGYRVYFQPRALVFHSGSETVGKDSAEKVYLQLRDQMLFLRRNASAFQFFVYCIQLFFFVFPREMIKYVFQRKWGHIQAHMQAVGWHLSHRNQTGQMTASEPIFTD